MTFKALFLATAALLPQAAVAQQVTGAATLGFGFGEAKDFNQKINSLTFEGAVGVDFGNGFKLSLRGAYADIDVKNLGVGISANLLAAGVSYHFANGGWVGAFTENADIGIDLLPVTFGTTSYGIEGGYSANGLDLGAFYGQSTDIKSFGLSAKYQPVDGAVIGASAIRSNLDTALLGADLNLTAIGLAGTYAFGDQWAAFAGVTRTSVSDVDADLTTFGIGASYAVQTGAFPVVVSAELARTKLDLGGLGSTDLDTVRLGVTIPFGTKGAVAPKNSVADSILNPGRSALTQTVLSAF